MAEDLHLINVAQLQSVFDEQRLGFLIFQRVNGGVIHLPASPTMNTKPTAIDVYLARAAAIHMSLARLQQLDDDHFGHDPDAIH